MTKFLSQFLNTVFFATLISSGAWASEDALSKTDAWTRLTNGTAIAIMRHALAPGTGDPAQFAIDDCTTQRNLSDVGRAQARSIGNLFRSKGITDAQVLTSQWCRCKDTAQLLNIGTPTALSALNSFFENRSTADDQTHELRAALPNWLGKEARPTVLVTHQVNISALTGGFTSSGEIQIITLEGDQVKILASIDTLN